ncbi:hypothetical protein P167DRAFT_578946 [Morchella conica CCBAS932]|uniref:t-SNARE coiled-coil homology domain-containing protein n=1 Tax=Morchella conica CCBAS932 TaxID=1392247 RepID=A0A3N4KBB1_9PEZI|nr:hypothetical protein P167DRAFT_578946 [Morchella conica CCBAS932]
MASTTADRLTLLQDHIRQTLHSRAGAARTPESDADIARSLSTLHAGIEQLEKEQQQLEEHGDSTSQVLREREDILIKLRTQHHDLHSLFTHPPSPSPPSPAPAPTTSIAPLRRSPSADTAAREALMGARETPSSLRKTVRFSDLDDNTQVLQLHQRVLEEQDEDLDRLSASIRNQRELSIQIGDELEGHVQLLDGVDELVERHTERLGGARRRLGGVVERGVKENGSLVVIVVLIVVLVVLIAVLKW